MKESTGKTRQSEHFTLTLMHAADKIANRLEEALGSVGLSMAKHSALSRLAEAGRPLTLSELAERLSCVRSNITQLVDRLEADGLVRRVADPGDRRSVRAELTQLGIEKQKAGDTELSKAQLAFARRISAADLMGLESALGALD